MKSVKLTCYFFMVLFITLSGFKDFDNPVNHYVIQSGKGSPVRFEPVQEELHGENNRKLTLNPIDIWQMHHLTTLLNNSEIYNTFKEENYYGQSNF
jgi:hypothetical protein